MSGFVFFTGHGLPDFEDFLSAAAKCPQPGREKPVYLGGDDVSRYVANPAKLGKIREVPFYYVSFASSPDIKGKEASSFYSYLPTLFEFERDPEISRSRDGHAAMSYDAAEVLINAARDLRSTAPSIKATPGTVWRQITALSVRGASGDIEYDPKNTKESQVPLDKAVTIMEVAPNNGNVVPTIEAVCGRAGTDSEPTLMHCPSDSDPGS